MRVVVLALIVSSGCMVDTGQMETVYDGEQDAGGGDVEPGAQEDSSVVDAGEANSDVRTPGEDSGVGPQDAGQEQDVGDEPESDDFCANMSHPNLCDQTSLFEGVACGEEMALSSPARIRRIDHDEWARKVGKPVISRGDFTAYTNPFDTPAHLAYSTYSEGVSIDSTSLDLYFTVIDQAAEIWSAPGQVGRGRFSIRLPRLDDPDMACMYEGGEVSDACRNGWLRVFLQEGIFSRPPTDEELQHALAYLDRSAIERGEVDRAVVEDVVASSLLSAGALFRDEIGEDVGDPFGRRKLSSWELALALSYLLDDRGPGAVDLEVTSSGDVTTQTQGRLYRTLVERAQAGTVDDEEFILEFIRENAAGIDPERKDLALDYDAEWRPRRSQYWMAPKIQRFFHEWLGYEHGGLVYKEKPEATSRFDDGQGGVDARSVFVSYRNSQIRSSDAAGYEPTYRHQLDDVVARVVVESASSDQQEQRPLLSTLLTTSRFYIPSPDAGEGDRSGRRVGHAHIVYGYGVNEGPEATREARWREVPGRSGVLTHPAWLGAHGGNLEDDLSLISRGKWVQENLLCGYVPPLEEVFVEANIEQSDGNTSARKRVVDGIESRGIECMHCHRRMNPLGYPFEQYNHAGFLRASDHEQGQPNGSTYLPGEQDDPFDHFGIPAEMEGEYQDVFAFTEALAQSEHVKRCFVRHTFRFFMGRNERSADACTLQRMETAYDDSQGSFVQMLGALATSDTFIYRTDAQGDEQ